MVTESVVVTHQRVYNIFLIGHKPVLFRGPLDNREESRLLLH